MQNRVEGLPTRHLGRSPAMRSIQCRSTPGAPIRRFGAEYLAILAAVLTVAATAQERADRPSPTIEETVEYINGKLATCPEPQAIRFTPPSMVKVTMPLFALRESVLVFDDYSSRNIWDFPKVPRTALEVSFDLADLKPVVKARKLESIFGNPSRVDHSEMFSETYGGGLPVYGADLACRGAPCFHIVGSEIPDQWRDANRERSPEVFQGRGERHLRGSGRELTIDVVSLADLVTGLTARLLVCDPDAADRVARAMVHLIRESGGEDELF